LTKSPKYANEFKMSATWVGKSVKLYSSGPPEGADPDPDGWTAF
jgi:hypothetical protein